MGKKKSSKRAGRSGTGSRQRPTRGRSGWLIVVVAIGIAATVSYFPSGNPGSVEQSRTPPVPLGWDRDWPPLPAGIRAGDPALIYAAYAFAARNPEAFRYIPCYCGCEGEGHSGLLDCFLDGRGPDGTPRWDRMGFG